MKPRLCDECDELLSRLNGDHPMPETWKPAPGDVLIGRVADLDEVAGEHGTYPVVVIEREDGARLAWHAMPAVARYELGKVAPEVGDRIAVRYDGKAEGRSYHMFRVVAEPRRIDWSRYRKPARA